jgi:hypothetical protein
VVKNKRQHASECSPRRLVCKLMRPATTTRFAKALLLQKNREQAAKRARTKALAPRSGVPLPAVRTADMSTTYTRRCYKAITAVAEKPDDYDKRRRSFGGSVMDQ